MSLVALWTFAAWVTLREGVNILWVSRLDALVTQPAEPLTTQIQRERRLTIVENATRRPGTGAALLAQEQAKTDGLIADFKRKASSRTARLAGSPAADERIDDTIEALEALVRSRPGSRLTVGSAALSKPYDDALDAFMRMYDTLATLDDDKFAADTRTLIKLVRTRELLSREDAFMAGVIASGRFTAADYVRFIELIGVQREDVGRALADLKETDPVAHDQLRAFPGLARLTGIENMIVNRGIRPGPVPAKLAVQWTPTMAELNTGFEKITLGAGDRLVERATPIAVWVVARLLLAGGLGLLAVVASIVLAITTTRHLVRQLERLRDAAHELSDVRLPRVVERLGHGEQVDVKAEAPPLAFGDDDIGKVGQAFNAVQETAIRTAVEQAELRRGIRDILLSLARRSQALVHRQLTLLDAMERREIDTEELEDLFRVDHLATRMRRNAENLIILSGATPARGWRRPVPMVDVVRSAVAEVEDYTRVTVMPIGEVGLVGRAVTDIAHLLAELIENAVSFSPPYTVAQISGHLVASGYAVEIEDRGLGMSDEALASINRRIANPPEFNLSSSVQLGLYVVGKLAERYAVQVTLKRSPYGGTTAVVVIPRELIEEGGTDAPPQLTAVGANMPDQEESQGASVHPLTAPVAAAPPPPPSFSPVAAVPAPPPAEDVTPSGLPVRVPQASLAEPLREEQAPEIVEDDPGRSPEEIRRIVGAFQSGSQRGRAASVESETE